MENAADSLKIAFAIFALILSLTIVFSLISKIITTANATLAHTDKTTYYEWEQGDLDERGRIVDSGTVITALQNNINNYTKVFINGIQMETNNKKDIENCITNYVKKDYYYEKIVEVTVGGKFRTADDGTKITITPGIFKTYIYYTDI